MPDFVLTKSKRITIEEGSNFTLRCDVLPGVNARRLWRKDGEVVSPSSEAGVDITDYSSTLVVNTAQVGDTGTWSCDAETSFGLDTIEYNVMVKQTRLACSEESPPVIQSITGLSLVNRVCLVI